MNIENPIIITDNHVRLDDTVRVVVATSFAKEIVGLRLSHNAFRILMTSIAQCKLHDNMLYEYNMTIDQFCRYFEVAKSNIYTDFKAEDGCINELRTKTLKFETGGEGSRIFSAPNLYHDIIYDEGKGEIKFQLHPKLSAVLLNLGKDNPFINPLLCDFKYSKSTRMDGLILYYATITGGNLSEGEERNIDVYLAEMLDVMYDKNDAKDKITIAKYKEKPADFVSVLKKMHLKMKENCGIDINITGTIVGKKRRTVGLHLAIKYFVVHNEQEKNEKIIYFEDEKLNKAFLDHIEWFKNEFNKKYIQNKTIEKMVDRLKEVGNNDVEKMLKSIEKTERIAVRDFVSPDYSVEEAEKKKGNNKSDKTKKNNSFMNFPQREYDYEELEKKLLFK